MGGETTSDFLAAGGEMGALTRAFDWSKSPLGSPQTWPQSLRVTVRLVLTSRHPMFIWWGPDLIQFYNDAYRETMGPERHPSALGGRGRECWDEIWDIIGPQVDYVMAGNGATWHEDQLVPVTRHGRREAGEHVGTLQWRCFARKAHPAFSQWGPQAWTKWPHLAVRVSDVLTSPVHIAASAAGLERKIAGWVPHFSAIAPILASSDLLATLPAITKAGLGHPYRLESREVPFPIAALPHLMLWNLGRNGDPEIAWLRDRLRPIIKSKFAGKPVT